MSSDAAQSVAVLPALHALALSPSSAASPSSSLTAPTSAPSSSSSPHPAPSASTSTPARREAQDEITYRAYAGEQDLDAIVALVDDELSEPYNLYTYRYFLDEWPHLCFFAYAGSLPIGVIICKQEPHAKSSHSVPIRPSDVLGEVEGGQPGRRPLNRGYLAMLSTKKEWRGRGVATHLLRLSLTVMLRPPPSLLANLPPSHPSRQPADEIVLETEADNFAALGFYAKMGFVREKRLHRFYLNSKDAYRLRLDLEALREAVEEGEKGQERL
ncbi:hypothetical protein JCM8097_007873 [Rhodosporidiobolus ruineniae]